MKIFVLIGILTCGFVGAAQESSMSGRITAEGKPVPFAHIYIQKKNIGTTSDEKGYYNLKDVPEENFILVISALGFNTLLKNIPIAAKRANRIDFQLEPTPDQLDEVILVDEQTGLTRKSPYNFSTIALTGIENIGNPGGIMGVVREEPGVYGAEFGQGIVKPFIRGLGFSRIVTIFQGNKLENHQWGADHGLGINDLGIKRINVIKGPASVLYGSGALGGVLIAQDDDHYLRSNSISGSTGFTYNSVSNGMRGYASAGGALKNHFFGAADVAYETHADYKFGSKRIIGNSRFNTSTVRLHAGLDRNKFRNKLSFTYHRQDLGIIDDREMENAHSLATSRNDRKMQLPFQLVSEYLLSYLQTTQGNIFNTSFHLSHHFNDRKEIEESFDLTDMGLMQNHTFYNFRINFTSGEFTHNLGSQGSLLQNRNMKKALDFLIPDARTLEYGFYYLGSMETGDFFFQAAFRYDDRKVEVDASSEEMLSYGFILPGDPKNSQLTRSFSGFTGSIGATKTFNDDNLIKLNFSTGYRAPDLAELFSNGPHPGTSRFERGNADFIREQSLQTDLTYTYRHEGFQGSVSAFASRINNYIFFTATDEEPPGEDLELWTYQQTTARFNGLEFELKKTWLPENRLETKITGAIVRAKDVQAKRNLTFIPPDSYSLHLKYYGLQNRSLHLFSRLRLINSQDKVGLNEQATEGYSLLNIGLTKEFLLGENSLKFGCTLHNALDRNFVDHMSVLRAFNVPGPGRNLMINLNFNF